MALTIGQLVGYLKIDRSKWDKGIDAAKAKMSTLGGIVEAVGRRSSIPLLAMQAAQLISAVAPASGALLAIPAALGVVAIAMSTVKVATAGMGDAMKAVASGDAKALDEALKKLSPNARAFVKSWQGLDKQFKSIQQGVQDRFFAGLDKDISGLSKGTLPALGVGLNSTARELNLLAREGIKAASTPVFAGQLEQAGTGAAGVLKEFHGSVAPLPGALLNIVNAGMPFVRSLGEMAAGSLKARAEFLGSEAGAARMRATIQRGVDTIKQMITIGQNLGMVLSGIFGRANIDGSGFLQMIVDLTARMAAWVQSAQGQDAIGRTFDQLAAVGARVAQILPQVIDAASWLLGVIQGLPAPVQDLVTTGIAWSIVLGPLATKLFAVGSALIGLLKGIPAVYGMVKAFILGIPAAYSWVAAHTAAAARTVAAWVAASARTVASLVVMGAQFVAQGAVMAASAAATAARVVAGWVLMGVQSMLQAARMAAAWLIAMGPVGWVIAAVIGLVALIIAYWDEIVAGTKAAWEWVSNAVSTAIDWVVDFVKNNWELLITLILGPLGIIIALVVNHWDQIVAFFKAGVDKAISIFQFLGQLPGMIGGWFRSVYDAAVQKLQELLGWLGGLGGRVLDALGDVGAWLVQTGRNLIEGLIRGVKEVAGRIADAVLGPIKNTVNEVKNFLGISSPSKLMRQFGSWTGQGFAIGLSGTEALVAAAAGRLAEASVPDVPVANPATSAVTAAARGSSGGDRGPLYIEHYHEDKSSSAWATASDLDWLSRNRG